MFVKAEEQRNLHVPWPYDMSFEATLWRTHHHEANLNANPNIFFFHPSTGYPEFKVQAAPLTCVLKKEEQEEPIYETNRTELKSEEQCKTESGAMLNIEEIREMTPKQEIKVEEEGLKRQNLARPEDDDSGQQDLDSVVSLSDREQEKPKKRRRKYVEVTDQNLIELVKIVESQKPPIPIQTLISQYKQELVAEIRKEAEHPSKADRYLQSQLDSARKNVTQHYLKLFKFALKVLKLRGIYRPCLTRVKQVLKSSLSTISTVLKIYREPSFSFFVDFLKNEVLTEQNLPRLIVGMPVKPADKLVMLNLIPGFEYALHHPEEDFSCWDLENRKFLGKTAHIAEAIKRGKIDVREATRMLRQLYDKKSQEVKECGSMFNNLSRRYTIIMKQAIEKLHRDGMLSSQELGELEGAIKQGGKSSSIKCIRQMLSIEVLRNYLRTSEIDTQALLVHILTDASISCRTKLAMMECYPKFVSAIDDPSTFRGWRR